MTKENLQQIILAGGCFWCTQADMANLKGIVQINAIYIGTGKDQPSYKDICSGKYPNLKEAVEVTYNANIISLQNILEFFFLHIDPTVENKQFFDIGTQYQTAIFYSTLEEQKIIINYINKLNEHNYLNTTIKTKVLPITKYWLAEDYHQQFHLKNPDHYNNYKNASMKEQTLKKIWTKYTK